MSLEVNGSTQYAEIALAFPSKPYTVAIWCKNDDTTPPVAASEFPWGAYDDVLTGGENIGGAFKTSQKFAILDEGGTTFSYDDGTNNYASNTWELTLCIFTSSTSRQGVLNGDWANRSTSSQNNGTDIAWNKATVGAGYSSGVGPELHWAGKLAGFCVWDIAFTEAMSDALWNSGTPQPPKLTQPSDIIHYTEFYNAVTSQIGNDAVLQNAPGFLPGDHPYSPGATVTGVDLVDIAGVAHGALSNLKWDWFDQDDPGNFVAPVDQGTTESTTAGGVLDLDLTNSVLNSGQTGTLVLRDSGNNYIGAYRLQAD